VLLRVVGMEIVFSREPNKGLFYRNEKENETEKREEEIQAITTTRATPAATDAERERESSG
jgi:hypothetical protein